jgi:hypothetical protein
MNKVTILNYLILVIATVYNIIKAQEHVPQTEDFIQIISFNSYHITNSVIVNNTSVPLTKLVIILPLAQTNNYQQVNNVFCTGSEILDIPETDDKYVRNTITGSELPMQGQTKIYGYDFDVTLYSILTDLDQITTIYPYDTTSNIYIWYTGKSGVLVDPNNSIIQSIGSNIWSQSSDLVNYAERSYEYVAQNFQYLNPGTGLHPLSELIANGGGDCGNLSSIYISLLRYKKIPSRHIVTVRPNGSYHVWADFYLENYGWIPVDVTHKLFNPNGNYFGRYDGNGIVLTKEVWLLLDRGDNYSYYCSLLQTYNWWWWGTSGGEISTHHNLNSTPTSVEEFTDFPKYIILSHNFPNPFNSSTTIEFDLLKTSDVTLNIFNILGEEVATLVSDKLSAGSYSYEWEAPNMSSGVYLYRLETEEFVNTKKMILMR